MAIDASGLMDIPIIKDYFKGLWTWVHEEPGAAAVVVPVILATLAVGRKFVIWIAKTYFSKSKDTTEIDKIKLFIESKEREIEMLTTKLADASFDKGQLYRQIDELKRQLAEPEKALKEDLKRNSDLGAQLDALRGRYDPNRVAAAKEAMARFDYDAAEAVFQQMRDDTAAAVKLQAAAELGLGEIAEARVDWPAAAQHYDRAADLNPTIDTLAKAADFLERNGQYDRAEARCSRVLSLVAAEHGADHERYAEALNDLAVVYYAQGKYDLAEATYKQALEIDRRTIGEDHPEFAIHLNNLAGVYDAQGKYDLAEVTYKQALETDRRTIGEDHPSFAIGLGNLAGVYKEQGRFDQAEETYNQAIAIAHRTVGENHPDFAAHLINLAIVFNAQGKYDLAEERFKQALEIDRRTIGVHHPDFALHLNNLSFVYAKTERYAEAVPLLEQALDIFKDRFPAGHPKIKNVQDGLDTCRAALAEADSKKLSFRPL